MTAEKSTRNLGVDLLRVTAMLFVIIQHILGQGGVAAADILSEKGVVLHLLQILVYCAVDIYGITTGYMLCRKPFRLARLVNLWLTTVFWSVAVSCVFFLAVPESRTFKEMVSMFLPILRGRYWFFTAYFVVMLVSPVLNVVIQSLNKRQFHLLFAALFLIFCVVPVCSLGYDVLRINWGQHFSWMSILYLIGGYLRYHGLPSLPQSCWLLGYFLSAAVHLLYIMGINLIGLHNFGGLLLTLTSPLIVAEAVCLFQWFRKLPIKVDGVAGRLIRLVTPGIYSVYIIHVHPLLYWNKAVIGAFQSWDAWSLPVVLCGILAVTLVLFSACILLDTLRQRLFRLLGIDRMAERVSDRIEAAIRKLAGE